MPSQRQWNRREVLSLALGATATTVAGRDAFARSKGRLRQGVSRIDFGELPLAECCKIASSLGIDGFDFVGDPKDWPLLKQHGMTVSMLRADYGGGISIGRSPPGPGGWNAIGLKEAQESFLPSMVELIDTAAKQQFPNVFVAAGDRTKVDYEQGADNTVEFLNKAKGKAESSGVTICLEILNSKGIQAPRLSLFDHMAWGVAVMKRVNSPRVKILYDVFHAQLMEGNIIQTIRDSIEHIGHVHLGGVPARHEIYRDSELDYRPIAQTLADLRFDGFVTHEWSPSAGSNVREDLAKSVEIMTV